MSDTPAPIEGGLSADERARLAGWDPADGPSPYEHSAPPEVDPALGNNGIPVDLDAFVIDEPE